jgi:hypothetical protein
LKVGNGLAQYLYPHGFRGVKQAITMAGEVPDDLGGVAFGTDAGGHFVGVALFAPEVTGAFAFILGLDALFADSFQRYGIHSLGGIVISGGAMSGLLNFIRGIKQASRPGNTKVQLFCSFFNCKKTIHKNSSSFLRFIPSF